MLVGDSLVVASGYVHRRHRVFHYRNDASRCVQSSLHFPSPLIDFPVLPGMNCFRMIRGFVDHATSPGGAVGYLGALAPWDHVFKDTLYATQEILGDGVAVSSPTYPTARLFSDCFRHLLDLSLLGYLEPGLACHCCPLRAVHRSAG